MRAELADLVCGKGTDPYECPRIDTDGYRVTTTLDLKMQDAAEKWLKAYIIAPNQGSAQATIDYLATLGITAKSDPFNYYRIVGPNPSTGTKTGLRAANMHNGALIAVDYRTGQVLAYAGSAGFYEKPVKNPARSGQQPLRPAVRRAERWLAAARLVLQADQLRRRRPGQDTHRGLALHGRRHRFRRRLYSP